MYKKQSVINRMGDIRCLFVFISSYSSCSFLVVVTITVAVAADTVVFSNSVCLFSLSFIVSSSLKEYEALEKLLQSQHQ